jgi:hypothetical protein
MPLQQPAPEQRRDLYRFADRLETVRPGPGLLTFGLAALGLGALAWYYLGPDLRRYMKIRSM